VGNVISGQVVGETAKLLSERFGRIVQERESISINTSETSVSRSTQLDSAIPPSKIAALSSGEFVGTVSDDPDQKINLKVFHSVILNNLATSRDVESADKPTLNIRKVIQYEILQNYIEINNAIQLIIEAKLKKFTDL